MIIYLKMSLVNELKSLFHALKRLLSSNGNYDHYEEHNYQVPWCRFSPYVWGIVLGYALHVTKRKPVTISKVKHPLLLARPLQVLPYI